MILGLEPGEWAALVSAVAAVLAVIAVGNQLRLARKVAAAQFVLDMAEQYDGPAFRNHRSRVARTLLLNPSMWATVRSLDPLLVRELQPRATPLLAHFSRLGMMSRKKLLPADFLWSVYFVKATYYHRILACYVETKRRESPLYYVDFDLLQQRLSSEEARQRSKHPTTRGSVVFPISDRELLEFLKRELHVIVRPFETTDVRYVLIDPDLKQTLLDHHSRGDFIGVAELLDRTQPDHEYLGFIVARIITMSDGHCGEVDRVVVDSRFRRLGVGRALADYVCHQMHQWGLPYCVTPRPGDKQLAETYKQLGFSEETSAIQIGGDYLAFAPSRRCLVRRFQT